MDKLINIIIIRIIIILAIIFKAY